MKWGVAVLQGQDVRAAARTYCPKTYQPYC